jgi:3-hydroxyisobutyrate dehydrogenase-like beta-hydroxyacid dehydrogenase
MTAQQNQNQNRTPAPVTLIGLGPMGRAMGRVLLDAGHPLTLWNRTSSKADELVAAGAVLAATPAEAVAANDLVILSLTHLDAMYEIFDSVGDGLAGRTVVNLSSDTPEKSRAAAAWVADRGGEYLTGGVKVPPPLVGTPQASTFYSGPKAVLDRHEPVLKLISSIEYKGEDPGLAALYYQLMMGIFWTTMTSFTHSALVARANGVTATEFTPTAKEITALVGYFLDDQAKQMDTDIYDDADASPIMAQASIAHVIETSRDAGIGTTLPEAVHAIYTHTIETGESLGSMI